MFIILTTLIFKVFRLISKFYKIFCKKFTKNLRKLFNILLTLRNNYIILTNVCWHIENINKFSNLIKILF